MSNFEVREDEDGIGKVLILKNAWSDKIESHMLKNKIYALRLSDSFGFKDTDLTFLSALTFLKSLEVYCWDAKNIKSIESLTQLEVLGLQIKSQQKLNLENFDKLRVLKVTWSKGLTSIFELKSVEKLNIQNYPNEDLSNISKMILLKKLYLTSRKLQSLNGITNFKQLESLDLYNCPQLVSTDGIEECTKLKTIEIEACRHLSA
ncbi:leucine-rich repeat domain-containing protein [Thalassotalea eurytherma]|nr:hypothetical protein [Thalassotalea eurytherma]